MASIHLLHMEIIVAICVWAMVVIASVIEATQKESSVPHADEKSDHAQIGADVPILGPMAVTLTFSRRECAEPVHNTGLAQSGVIARRHEPYAVARSEGAQSALAERL